MPHALNSSKQELPAEESDNTKAQPSTDSGYVEGLSSVELKLDTQSSGQLANSLFIIR